MGVDAYGIDTLIFSPEIKDALMFALIIPNVIYIFLAMVISIKDKRYSDPTFRLTPTFILAHSFSRRLLRSIRGYSQTPSLE